MSVSGNAFHHYFLRIKISTSFSNSMVSCGASEKAELHMWIDCALQKKYARLKIWILGIFKAAPVPSKPYIYICICMVEVNKPTDNAKPEMLRREK